MTSLVRLIGVFVFVLREGEREKERKVIKDKIQKKMR